MFIYIYIMHIIIGLKCQFIHYFNYDLSIFGFMYEFWTATTVNMMCTRSQNYTNMMVSKHGIQAFKVVVVVLLIFSYCHLIFSPISVHPV